ncbi:response regulator transcription factor [Streptomyces sp. ISL-36]|uniref:LuxR C-terminal-related transcriptional regulator n=1 Tax=Streptomyces sp. ISL-36 TaxID=2819182 RepID=UPI001BE6C982|nr:response regulator transcription factor [Streptomyces sp. ISL-36]MBT2441557.1 response regulator transcription factor [Streptomyces sp. ISL-36]
MSTQQHAHVLVADDSPTRTLGIIQIVRELSYVTTISTSTFSGLADAVGRTAPDLVLLSTADSPDEDLTTFVRPQAEGRTVRFITFGHPARTRITPSSVSAGLHGFLPSSATPEDFDRALSATLAGFTYFPSEMVEELARYRMRFPQLTPREQQVLDLLSGGLSNHRIAKSLGIKEATVKMYVTHVLAKLKVESRLQACLKARGLASAAA